MREIINEEKTKCQQIVDEMMLQFSRIREKIEFFFANHEYNENSRTIYKGSIKESKDFLRFKERFKMSNLLDIYSKKRLCREVI